MLTAYQVLFNPVFVDMYPLLFAIFTVLLGFSACIQATPVMFINDKAGFTAETQSLIFQQESFELSDQQWRIRCATKRPEACAPANRYANNMQFGRVNVSTGEADIFRIETAYKNSGDFVSDGLSSIAAAPGGYQSWGPVTFRFDMAINAVEFDLLDIATSIGTSVLSLSTDRGFQSLLFALPGADENNGRQDLIALYDPDENFTAFTLSFDCNQTDQCATDDLIGVDRLRFASVPEPGTGVLIFGGFLLLPFAVKRFQQNRAVRRAPV
jgi:hypothetical protein